MCLSVFPEIAYVLIIVVFYVLAATIVNQIVFQSVESYLENYKSQPEKITYMCFNILGQGILLTVGFFCLFAFLVTMLSGNEFRWDDPGFVVIASSIFAGATNYPKRDGARKNDYFLNSFALFVSIKVISWVIQLVL